MTVKFHEKAIAIFGCAQNAEGNHVVKSATDTTGTVTIGTGANTVTGSGTKFQYGTTPGDGMGDLTIGAYIYDNTGVLVGRIATISSQTSATLEANGAVAISGASYAVGLGPKNAVAVLNLNFSTELTTEAFQYVGNELDRDEKTVVKDKFAKFDFETFLPALGTIAGTDPVLSEVPYPDWFQAAGMATVLSTGSGGYVKFTNGVSSNTYLTVEIRRSSPDMPTLQKTFYVGDMRGSFDLDMTVGTKVKLKWNFMGNLISTADLPKIDPDFGTQKTELMGTVSSHTVVSSQLSLYSGPTEPTFVSGTKTVCFDKLNAPNVSGFDYSRYQTSCIDGWSKGATPTDVTLTILEDKTGAAYNPDAHVEEDHGLYLEWGSVTGYKALVKFHKVELAGLTNSKVATYAGRDLKFRNIQYTDIILS